MSYTVDGLVPWPVPAEWTRAVRERLVWLTRGKPGMIGIRQKARLRRHPRRTFDFEVVCQGAERQLLELAIADRGAAAWQLPIYPDLQLLSAPLAEGVTSIVCATEGYDFAAGARALLWRSTSAWELVGVDAVLSGELVLASATSTAWPTGTRLYPVRNARIEEPAQDKAFHDAAGRRSVTMVVTEPCAWPALAPEAEYRGYPVLEERPETSQALTTANERSLILVDSSTGPVSSFDFAAEPFRRGNHAWKLKSRAQAGAFRSLAYWLQGQGATFWRPTWSADLTLAGAIDADDTQIAVAACGYSVFGRGQWHCRDVRIELLDGTVFYRRVSAWEAAGGTELLTLDAALGMAVTPAQVLLISFLQLMEQAADSVELEHVTGADGLTRVGTSFRAVKRDV